MIRAIALDDEPKAISIIKHHASQIATLDLIKTFNDPELALSYLNINKVDLLFLDINMPKLSGFDLLSKLDKQPLVIITSAYAEYGVKSYSYEVVDYLLKPFELDRFTQAIDKAAEKLSPTEIQKSIVIRDGYDRVLIHTSEILYVKSDGNYLDIYLETKKLSPRMTFTKLLELLPKEHFVRVHNSYVVNLSKVEKIQSDSVKIGDQFIPVSNSHKAKLQEKISF